MAILEVEIFSKKGRYEMPKRGTWVGIVLSGVLGLCLVSALISGFISGIKKAHNDESVFTKKIINHKCINCGQVITAETTDVRVKRGVLQGKKIVIENQDTLCGPCKLKLAPKAEGFFQEGQIAYNSKDYVTARKKFYSAESLGSDKAVIWREKTNSMLNRITAAEEKKKSAEEEADKAIGRKGYVIILREHFLDQNMDIKVWVSGPGNKYLHMQNFLFDDVWVHNFKKGDLAQEIQQLGFERVYFTDGYNYSTYVYWN